MTAQKTVRLIATIAVIAIGINFTLGAIEVPSRFHDRLAYAGQQNAEVVKFTRPKEPAPHANICITVPDTTALNFAEILRLRLTEHGLTVTHMHAGSVDELDRRPFTAVDIRFEASGSYLRAAALLEDLASSAPMLTVDSLDLASVGSNVELKFSGQVVCAG